MKATVLISTFILIITLMLIESLKLGFNKGLNLYFDLLVNYFKSLGYSQRESTDMAIKIIANKGNLE